MGLGPRSMAPTGSTFFSLTDLSVGQFMQEGDPIVISLLLRPIQGPSAAQRTGVSPTHIMITSNQTSTQSALDGIFAGQQPWTTAVPGTGGVVGRPRLNP